MTVSKQDTTDGFIFTGSTGDTMNFRILGGKYLFFGSAAGTSVTLNMLLPDNTTYQAGPTGSAQTTTAFAVVLDLPQGSYQIVTVTVSAVQGGLVKIPYNPAY